MVITGATSGIGLTTARMAARLGANLVLAARNGGALDHLASQLGSQGAKVATVVADVGKEEDVARIARRAVERFGHFDTWVNNAGISVYGRLDEVDIDDFRRLFDTNFWGVVYGSREAVKHFKKHGGGALINLGSEVSEVAIPLQGMYAASKHAIKGFTNSLRIELEKDGAPISVTLIKPAGIDTMFTAHAKNYMDKEPALPPPVYAPDVVADAIVYAAQHPQRDVFIGSAAKLNAASAYHAPRLLDKIFSLAMFSAQKGDQPSPPNRRDALYAFDPNTELRERSGMLAKVHESSSYTKASLQAPSLKNALIGGGLLFAAWSLARRQNT
jgi:short-subunit dehydrogenase